MYWFSYPFHGIFPSTMNVISSFIHFMEIFPSTMNVIGFFIHSMEIYPGTMNVIGSFIHFLEPGNVTDLLNWSSPLNLEIPTCMYIQYIQYGTPKNTKLKPRFLSFFMDHPPPSLPFSCSTPSPPPPCPLILPYPLNNLQKP